jgi:hypothetical protein
MREYGMDGILSGEPKDFFHLKKINQAVLICYFPIFQLESIRVKKTRFC